MTKVATAIQADGAFVTAVESSSVVTITDAAAGDRTSNATSGDTAVYTAATTVEGSSAVAGWGSSKDFSGVLQYAQKLVLHPVALADSALTRDITFWKAYPQPGSITYSSENPQLVEVSFMMFPDLARAGATRLFAFGDVSTSN